MPFQLVKVERETTVGELALQHEMPNALLWALNAGTDPDGMFRPDELTEEVLGSRTLPLQEAAPAPSAAAAAPAPSAAAAPAAPADACGALAGVDLAFGGRSTARRTPRANKPAQTDPREGRIKDGELRKMDMNGVLLTAAVLANLTVRAGTVIRVVQTHRMDRRSSFVDKYLQLDKERSVHRPYLRLASQTRTYPWACTGSACVPCTQ